jgi:CBS domain-containing protein
MNASTINGKTRHRHCLSRLAKEIMTPHPLSISETATVNSAAAFLTEKSISAAPVVNKAGRPVGVVSRADIVRHAHTYDVADLACVAKLVRDIMTSTVFFVRPDTSVDIVIDNLLASGVHRLFVVDGNDVLIGVISTLDLLRHFQIERGERRSGLPTAPVKSIRRPAPWGSDARRSMLKPIVTGSDIVLSNWKIATP